MKNEIAFLQTMYNLTNRGQENKYDVSISVESNTHDEMYDLGLEPDEIGNPIFIIATYVGNKNNHTVISLNKTACINMIHTLQSIIENNIVTDE